MTVGEAGGDGGLLAGRLVLAEMLIWQRKELWGQEADCTCREDEPKSDGVFAGILKRQKPLRSVMQRRRVSKRWGQKDFCIKTSMMEETGYL